MHKLDISEIFCSFQGESSLMGKPTVFLRLAGCNLNCSICDTRYSFKSAISLSLEEILLKLDTVNIPYLCITGGEPLLQFDDLLLLLEKLKNKYKIISLETNGSISINKLPAYIKKVVDVKTPSTNQASSFNLENLKYLTDNDELKFVISDKLDFDFAIQFLSKNNLFNTSVNILFSPNLAIDNCAGELARWILASGFDIQFQPQLHKLIVEKPVYLVH